MGEGGSDAPGTAHIRVALHRCPAPAGGLEIQPPLNPAGDGGPLNGHHSASPLPPGTNRAFAVDLSDADFGRSCSGCTGRRLLCLVGVQQRSRALINYGVVCFALAVLWFYFSNVMGKLGRSFSLMLLGLLFLGGGWILEKTRRRLVRHVEEAL